MQSGNEFFSKMLKGLGSNNNEKETDTKKQCDIWISQTMSKQHLKDVAAFFEYVKAQIPAKYEAPTTSLLGAVNAFGIFVHSIKDHERLKEKYIPLVLDKLVECYFIYESDSKVSPLNDSDKNDHSFEPTDSDNNSPVSDIPETPQDPRVTLQDEKWPRDGHQHILELIGRE